jgi:hypothetical protein
LVTDETVHNSPQTALNMGNTVLSVERLPDNACTNSARAALLEYMRASTDYWGATAFTATPDAPIKKDKAERWRSNYLSVLLQAQDAAR